MKKWMTIGALAFAVVAADASLARAQDGFVDENGDGVDDAVAHIHRRGGRGFLRGVRSQLTDEQKAEIKTAVESLKESGATREAIHDVLAAMLNGYGVEVPERGDHLTRQLGRILSEDQLAEVQAKIEELKAAEASGSDIRAAVGSLLEGYSVDVPTRRGGLDSVLSDDQHTQLRTEIDALKEAGASREDVRAAFEAKLGEFGVDPSALQGGRKRGRRGGKFRGRRGGRRSPAPAPAADGAADAS